MKLKDKAFNIFSIILTASMLWVSISTIIQMSICPEMTQTELFFNIPRAFIFDFDYCK